ncbi:MAG TPA: hypothetical protein VEJ63_08040 [Planctomycetota bacterium]|nr:hypothetical protein [Planctomycetota bacterium]
MSMMTAARALGIASIGIGLAEVLAPKKLERAMGINNGQNTGILRALGARELMHGVDILAHRNPIPGVWGRVAGDMLDGVLLAAAMKKTRRQGAFAAMAASVLLIGALDLVCAAKGRKAVAAQ